MSGHVFVVRGDLTRLSCDAVLVPCGPDLKFIDAWDPLVTDPVTGHRPSVVAPVGWDEGSCRTFPLPIAAAPQRWATNVADSWQRFHDTEEVMPSPRWHVEGAVEFVRAAAEELRDSPSHRTRPLLALPVVATGEGGAQFMAGTVLKELLPALWDVAEEADVDVVVVCRDAPMWAAAQWVRRSELQARGIDDAGHWKLDQVAVDEASRLAGYALAGDLVVFLGAGVSQGAGLPSWIELLRALAQRAGLRDGELSGLEQLHPLDQARVIRRRLEASGRDLRSEITALVEAPGPAIAHQLLACLPVREFVTTNYDALLEMACDAAQDPASVLPYDPSPQDRWILKLHGSVNADDDDLVLTREDFLRYPERRGALAGIVQALLITRHMLFAGYSLDDDNFHRIADEVRRALPVETQKEFGTTLAVEHAPMIEELWQHELRFVAFGKAGDDIAEAIDRHDRFLDLLVYLATDPTEHLLDDRFVESLDEDARRLRDGLRDLHERLDPELLATPAGRRFVELLRGLGHPD